MKQNLLKKILATMLLVGSANYAYALDDAQDGTTQRWTTLFGSVQNVQDTQNPANHLYSVRGFALYGKDDSMGVIDIGNGDVLDFDMRIDHNYALYMRLAKEGTSVAKQILLRPQNSVSEDMHARFIGRNYIFKPLPLATKDGTFHRVTIDLNTIFGELHLDKEGYRITGVYFFNFSTNNPLYVDNIELTDATGADTAPPALTLNGSNSITLTVGDSFVDPGVTAIDNFDGDISDTVTVTGSVDTATPGNYILLYTATDSAGNSASVARGVIVQEATATSNTYVKKTGQTLSYNRGGVEITDASLKDDGFYQSGIDPVYTRDDTKEVVIDVLRGKMWQDDAAAQNTFVNWQNAVNYCSALTLGGFNDWRLPTRAELQDITDQSRANPTIDPIFLYTKAKAYWTQTSRAGSGSLKWQIGFTYGHANYDSKFNNYYVRCVRDDR